MQIDISQIIIDRCTELGISLEMARLIGNESGYGDTAAVCWAIGLDPATLRPLRQRNWILMAAATSSVSYRTKMPEEAIVAILASGEVPSAFTAHVSHLLDDAPAQILVMAAEQAGLQTGQPMAAIWTNIFNLAKTTGSLRPDAWYRPAK
jgi:hypothetical protein